MWSRPVVWRRAASLVVALVAVRKRVHMRVVEKRPGAVSPRETLQKNPKVLVRAPLTQTGFDGSDLAADAEVGVGHKLRLLVAVALLLQEGVEHAHTHAWQGHHEGQDLPSLS